MCWTELNDNFRHLIDECVLDLIENYPGRVHVDILNQENLKKYEYEHAVWGANIGNWDKEGSAVEGAGQANAIRMYDTNKIGFGVITTPLGITFLDSSSGSSNLNASSRKIICSFFSNNNFTN